MNYCVGLGVGDWGVYSSNAPVRGRVGRRGEDKRGKATQLRFLPSLFLRRGLTGTGEISCPDRKRSSPPEIDSALAISYLATRPDEDTLSIWPAGQVRLGLIRDKLQSTDNHQQRMDHNRITLTGRNRMKNYCLKEEEKEMTKFRK